MKFKFENLIIWQKGMKLAEVVTCLHKAKNRKYISITQFDTFYEYSFNLMNMMIGFKRSIK